MRKIRKCFNGNASYLKGKSNIFCVTEIFYPFIVFIYICSSFNIIIDPVWPKTFRWKR